MSLADDAPGAERASIVPPTLGYSTIALAAISGAFIAFATGHELPTAIHRTAVYGLLLAAVALIVAWGVVRIDRHTDERVRALEVAVAANAVAIDELRELVGGLRSTVERLAEAAVRPQGTQHHRKRPRDNRPAATPAPAVLSPIDEVELRGYLRGALDREEGDD